jgi:D-sedoheptulose 7-phosphate isomerase
MTEIQKLIPPTAADPSVLVTLADAFGQRWPDLSSCLPDVFGAYRTITDGFDRKAALFLAGNGGSFADAVHIKGELAKSFERARPVTDPDVVERLGRLPMGEHLLDTLEAGLPVIVLGESHALRSAFENDRDPVLSYAQELNAFLHGLRDGVFLGISTSGNARNVLAAMSVAKAYQCPCVSFTGPGGGELASIADLALKVPGNTTADVQEAQFPIYHLLCKLVEAHYFPTPVR